MAYAAYYAELYLRSVGSMPPTLFLIGNDGPMMFSPKKLASDQDKDEFATTARLICIAQNASACIMALEAWMKVAKPNEKLDMTELPSEAIDRQEVIVLMGEDRKNQRQQFPLKARGEKLFSALLPKKTGLSFSSFLSKPCRRR